jgi:hypothetical protein
MGFTIGGLRLVLHSGAWIPVLVMLPNVIWALLPKKEAGKQAAEPLFLTIAENMGRVAILVLPFFYDLNRDRDFALPALIVMGLALAIYYACWVRYFAGGSKPVLMGKSFLGIPQPMAVAPAIFLLLSAYLMGSWWMFGAALFFGIAHIWVSVLTL